jgi:hypothetical protein
VVLAGCGRIGFDSIAADAGGDAVAATRCPTPYLICEDFEQLGASGGFGPWTPYAIGTGALIEVVPMASPPPLGGQYSLHAKDTLATAIDDARIDQDLVSIVGPSEMLALREYIWIVRDTTPASVDVEWAADTTSNFGPVVFVDPSTSPLTWGLECGGTGCPNNPLTPSAPAASTWICLEMDIAPGGGTTVYFDDVPAVPTGAMSGVSFQRVVFGLVGFFGASSVSAEVYVDDIVVAHQHVGCER